jgi:hypothetical protein
MKTMTDIQTRMSTGQLTRRTRRVPVVWTVGLALFALALPTKWVLAQVSYPTSVDVTGTVVNKETGKPVANAIVYQTSESAGVLTDAKGHYTLDDVKAGKASISAQKLGYETLTWKGTVGPHEGPPTLELPPKDSVLVGLHKEIARFAQRRQSAPVAVQSFDEGELASSTQPNVMDFVDARAGVANVDCPGLLGSDECYQVQGMIVLPIVYLNDQPLAGGEGYLRSMSPQDLYLLEVYAHGAEIRVYTPQFMLRAARTDYRPLPLGL